MSVCAGGLSTYGVVASPFFGAYRRKRSESHCCLGTVTLFLSSERQTPEKSYDSSAFDYCHLHLLRYPFRLLLKATFAIPLDSDSTLSASVFRSADLQFAFLVLVVSGAFLGSDTCD